LEIYNRFSLDLFQVAQKPDDVAFTLINSGAYTVSIHPANPALQKRNARFFVFPAPLADPAGFDLQPFVRIPERHIWIYTFKQPKPAGAEASTPHPLE